MSSEWTEEYGGRWNPSAELRDIKVFEENGRYFLDVSYIIEDKSAKSLLRIPRIVLPIKRNEITLNRGTCGGHEYLTIEEGNSQLYAMEDSNGECASKTVIKKKIRKMTLAEIEEKLGYGIEIVGETVANAEFEDDESEETQDEADKAWQDMLDSWI